MSLEQAANEKEADRLPKTTLTLTDVNRFELMEELNQIHTPDDIPEQHRFKYKEYKKLKETAQLDRLLEDKERGL